MYIIILLTARRCQTTDSRTKQLSAIEGQGFKEYLIMFQNTNENASRNTGK